MFNSQGASSAGRAEFDRIQAAFGKLPPLAAGNASKILAYSSTGLALEGVTTTGTGYAVRATDPTFTLTDSTTNNASTSQHGWMQKYPGGTSIFLRGDGSFGGVGNASMIAVQRTSNTALVVGDTGKIFELNGNFTQTFSAVASLAVGWYAILKHTSTSDTDEITLDPNGAETIDGLTTFKMYKGEARLVYVNEAGTALKSIVLNAFDMVITATMTFTTPPGYRSFAGLAWGAGASGQRTNDITLLSRGGGGGCCVPFLLKSSSFGVTETIAIGSGGAAVSAIGSGLAGGSTLIGAMLSVPGGSNGDGGSINSTYPTAAAGMQAIGYQGGSNPSAVDLINSEWGGAGSTKFDTRIIAGSSVHGGGGGGSCSTTAATHSGGASTFGGVGGASVSAASASAGTAPAGGGGATQTGTFSGAGARGEVRMHGVI